MEFSGEYDEKEVVVSTPPFDLKTDDVIRTEFRLPKNIDSEEDYKPTDWKEIILSVAKSTCQYNDRLTKERTLLRGAVYNSQLQQMHFQQSKVLATKPLRKTSKFPVACIESQFTDLPARRYDSKELAELCETPPEIYRRKPVSALYPLIKASLEKRQASRKTKCCVVCEKYEKSDKKFLICSNCHMGAHAQCLEISPELEKKVHSYDWQCSECKTCRICDSSDNEDKFMFCDECDRGYHTFCVGLKRLPIGRWICNDCGKCASCGSTTPGESVLHNVHWKHEYSKPKDENTPPKFLQTLCVKCSRLFRNGDYCPICLKVYSNSNDEVPMICCDDCDRWIHIECDNIDRKQYEEMENKHYSCGICRNIIPEKVNN